MPDKLAQGSKKLKGLQLEDQPKRTFQINIQVVSTLHMPPVHPEDIPSAYDFKEEIELAARELLEMVRKQK